MTGGYDDAELAEDLVGVTSARLVAAGVPRAERLDALRLLSILATLADTDGRVRRPLTMVASEFDLPAAEAELWLDDLRAVGAVERGGSAIVLGGREPARHVRMTLHDFLDAADELDQRPAPAGSRRAPLGRRAGALVAAAAAVAALAMVGPAVLEDRSAPVSATREPPSAGGGTTTTTGATAGRADDPVATPSPTAATEGTDATPEPEQVGPVIVTTTTVAGLPCPDGLPVLEVLDAATAADGTLTVEGVARNPTGEDLVIDDFVLRAVVAGEEVAAPALDGALAVPDGGEVRWQTRLPIVVAPGTAGTDVTAELGAWHWSGIDPSRNC